MTELDTQTKVSDFEVKAPGKRSSAGNLNGDTSDPIEKPAIEDGVTEKDGEPQYLPMGPRLYSITLALMLGVFCVALDNNVSDVPGKGRNIKPAYTNDKYNSEDNWCCNTPDY